MADLDDGPVVVLVVEDETLVRLLANDILSEAGYRVLEARDGQEALTILEVHDDVGALFTDVNMPHVDGLSLAKIVAERWPSHPALPKRPKGFASFASHTTRKRSWRPSALPLRRPPEAPEHHTEFIA